ncbi:MAG: hypothetical protein LBS53_11780 [Synergistaceae bacterium]|jgi:hypothetical protein|nr:hypothetical protein [Synergistaceae bacterium]
MSGNNPETSERIKRTALDTDRLIVRLDTLAGRIDTAKANDNEHLAEYYEGQFAEASVEFMNDVESILDDWYALNGGVRPPAQTEYIAPETLDVIHDAVVSIVQGLPLELPEAYLPSHDIDEAQGVNVLKKDGANIGRPGHKVDFTG